MGAYESMKGRLALTGLYTLNGSTAVDFELKAYAAGLDEVYNMLNELQKESFVSTAQGYGLGLREAAYGLQNSGETVQARRSALLALGAVTPDSFTKADIESLLCALGLSVQIAEDTANKKLTVHFLKEPPCGRDAAQKILEKFTPAHLTLESDFSGVS